MRVWNATAKQCLLHRIQYLNSNLTQLINPYTHHIVSQKEYVATDQIYGRVRATVDSYRQWREVKLQERADRVKTFVDSILADKEKLKPIIAGEIGKSFKDIDREYARLANLAPDLISSGLTSLKSLIVEKEAFKLKKVSYEPVGVALIFPYFSQPIFDSLIHLIPCLISGGGAVIKSSDFNHFLGPYLVQKAQEALKLPALVSELYINPSQLQQLAQIRNIKKVIYSGSQGSARHIFETFVKGRFIDCNLFFGGQDAAYVDKTANLKHAAKQICRQGFYNNGQSYDCIKRLYIAAEIEEQFLGIMREQIEKIQFGDPKNAETDMGPLCIQETTSMIEQLIQDSVLEGAVCETGGIVTNDGNQTGMFLEPTLLSSCENNMPIMQIKVNAPIICAIAVQSREDFVRSVNENVYGTGVRIFAKDLDRYREVIDRLNVGRIVFNSGSMFRCNLPIEGWKQSGKGKILSELSYEEYSIPKSYNIRQL